MLYEPLSIYLPSLIESSSILFPSSTVSSNCGGGNGLSPSNIIVIVVGILAPVLLMALLSTVALFFVYVATSSFCVLYMVAGLLVGGDWEITCCKSN